MYVNRQTLEVCYLSLRNTLCSYIVRGMDTSEYVHDFAKTFHAESYYYIVF